MVMPVDAGVDDCKGGCSVEHPPLSRLSYKLEETPDQSPEPCSRAHIQELMRDSQDGPSDEHPAFAGYISEQGLNHAHSNLVMEGDVKLTDGSTSRGMDLSVRRRAVALPHLCTGMPQFDDVRFRHEGFLVPAPRCCGQIELYFDNRFSRNVAVKRVPRRIMRGSPEAFHAANPFDPESPWQEFAVLRKLSRIGQKPIDGVAKCYGAFTHANGDAMLVIEYFPDGDLFTLATRLCDPGWNREMQVFPLMLALVGAVSALHSRDIAHGDVSLENAMWRSQASGFSSVALIDFGAAVTADLSNARGIRGKASYQAPEMHMDAPYNARAADLFSLGVAVYALVLKVYPWTSTKPKVCRAFTYAQKHGCEAFLRKKEVVTEDGSTKSADAVLSPFTKCLLVALLTMNPRMRMEAFDAWAAQALPPNLC